MRAAVFPVLVGEGFFLDTAKNIFLYIRTIASILRHGGAWVNLGPLLFHYAESPGEVSIELSWEEAELQRVFIYICDLCLRAIPHTSHTSARATMESQL